MNINSFSKIKGPYIKESQHYTY